MANNKPPIRTPHASHGLYFHPEKFEIEPNSHLGKLLKSTVTGLLERFPLPVPLIAQAIAKRAAYKLIRAASFEAFVLQNGESPAPKADESYLHLTGSIRTDLSFLFQMSKEGPLPVKPPSLDDYLKRIALVDKENE